MNQKEQERRARLMKMQAERLPDIKKRFKENQNRPVEKKTPLTGEEVIFEEVQKRNFNSNFKPGGKDAHLVKQDVKVAVKRRAIRNEKDQKVKKTIQEQSKIIGLDS